MPEGPSLPLPDVYYYAEEWHAGLVERCAKCGEPLHQEARSWLSTHKDCLEGEGDTLRIRVSLRLTNAHPA